ncbi:MAG: FG-GAP repeat domain-containing protein [Planctomycetota bacterium]|jgi:hypothetical protein
MLRLQSSALAGGSLSAAAALVLGSGALAQTPTVHSGFPVTVEGNAVSSVALVEIDGDAELELIQVVGSTAGSSVHVLNPDGSAVPGWPQPISQGVFSAPAFGDVDGDGEGEVVLTNFFFGISGAIYVFEADGTPKTGFPLFFGGTLKNPSLGDVDFDGALEIACTFNNGGKADLFLMRGDGTLLPGWPIQLDSNAGAAPSIGDLDGDGIAEIVCPSLNQIHVFDVFGNPRPGFPLDLGNQQVSYSSISLADMDGDGDRELVFGTQHQQFVDLPGGIWVVDGDGTTLPGWPQQTNSSVYTPPSVADVDGDGSPDVIAGDQLLSPFPVNYMYGFDADGNDLPGFPVGPIDALHQQVTIADVDGDGEVELLYETNVAGQSYYALNHDGTPQTDWPLPANANGQSFNQQLSVGDVDADGLLEIVGTVHLFQTSQTEIVVWDTVAPWDPALAPMPTHMQDVARSGHVNGDVSPRILPYGCGVNPSGSLQPQGGLPVVGGSFAVGVDNPLGTQPAGSLAILTYAPGGLAAPCGPLIPGFGQAGSATDGELLVELTYVLAGILPWNGAGLPASFNINVPADNTLIGKELIFQGAIIDFGGGVGLTEGLRLRAGL